MTAPVVSITDAAVITEPKRRARELGRVFSNALRVLWNLEAVDKDLVRGISDFPSHLERRVRQLERTIRDLLARPEVTAKQREGLLTVLYGVEGPTRDAYLLSDTERRLLDGYRQLEAQPRSAIRALVRGLTGGAR